LEGRGLESQKGAPTLDNSPWGEPIYCEPINVCPLQVGRRLIFLNKKLQSG